MKTQYATIFFLGFIQLSLVSSCLRNKNIVFDSSPKDTINQTIDLDLLPRDTINFNDLPLEAQEIFIPYIGFSIENLKAIETLDEDYLFNLSEYDIQDSADMTIGTHNYIFYLFSPPPKRFISINNKPFCIIRNIPKPFVFYENFFIYPSEYIEYFNSANESDYIVIDLKKYLEE